MCQERNPEGTVSDAELSRLCDLFSQFEGATDPLSLKCKEAESAFNSLVEEIYLMKVKEKFSSLSLSAFRSHARNVCRKRVSAQTREFPSP